MQYIGISCGFHDASISVIDDKGNINFAGHSERYSKIKHDKNLCPELINDALKYVHDDFTLHYYENTVLKILRQFRAGEKINLYNFFPSYVVGKENHKLLNNKFINIHGHHLCHASAGFQTSKFDDATVVIIDAIGEFDTITIWDARYINGIAKYKKLYSLKYPNSIGLFYSAITKHVGLKPLDEEYILMGMAAFGTPLYYRDLQKQILDENSFLKFKENLHAGINLDYIKNIDLCNMASSAQALLESMIRNVLGKARILGKSTNLVYGGGVALNCLANIFLGDYFKKVWILPNPGDSGSSLGAAAIAYKKRLNWKNAFLGHDISGDYPVNAILDNLLKNRIVGVASGRAEFGPRALGNRSLLADPRHNDIKDKVNEIKKRQKFRPFAPVILSEMADKYFIMPTIWASSPYMQSVMECRYPNHFPAIVHHDGTSRVQTVEKDGSGLRELLEKWYVLTECPMLLNTSLNIRHQPIVNDRHDADMFEKLYNVNVLS